MKDYTESIHSQEKREKHYIIAVCLITKLQKNVKFFIANVFLYPYQDNAGKIVQLY